MWAEAMAGAAEAPKRRGLGGWLRWLHRWVSMAFLAMVALNLAFLFAGRQSVAVGIATLFPLVFLMASGLWMFVAPYVRRRGRQAE